MLPATVLFKRKHNNATLRQNTVVFLIRVNCVRKATLVANLVLVDYTWYLPPGRKFYISEKRFSRITHTVDVMGNSR